jgi:hypothetical protein
MAAYSTLRRRAAAAANWRGHSLKWARIRDSAPHTAMHSGRIIVSAECRHCGASVTIDTAPPANGIDIGGSAVATNCPPMG